MAVSGQCFDRRAVQQLASQAPSVTGWLVVGIRAQLCACRLPCGWLAHAPVVPGYAVGCGRQLSGVHGIRADLGCCQRSGQLRHARMSCAMARQYKPSLWWFNECFSFWVAAKHLKSSLMVSHSVFEMEQGAT